MWDFPLFPERASSIAGDVDALYFVLTGLSSVIALGVLVMIVYYGVKYRSGNDVDRSGVVSSSLAVEVTWIVVPFFLAMGMFAWAAFQYFDMYAPPRGEKLEISTVGRQWMWKFQHPNGPREINTLHVPVGRTVQLTMTSQDVIHSFFVPAFRTKQDVLPGRYTTVWFQPTKTGRYRLFCAEYCGTEHSQMDGWVYVMEPAQYEEWLRTGATGGSNTEPGTGRFDRAPTGGAAGEEPFDVGTRDEPLDTDILERGETAEAAPPLAAPPMAEAGEALFQELRCHSCHRTDSMALHPAVGPNLQGVYGQPVELQNNRTVMADEQYLRESILHPQAKIVAGYPPVMPTFKGQISEEELLQLIAYLKSLSSEEEDAPADTTSPMQ